MLYHMFLRLSADYNRKANAEIDGRAKAFYLGQAKVYAEAANKLPTHERDNQYERS